MASLCYVRKGTFRAHRLACLSTGDLQAEDTWNCQTQLCNTTENNGACCFYYPSKRDFYSHSNFIISLTIFQMCHDNRKHGPFYFLSLHLNIFFPLRSPQHLFMNWLIYSILKYFKNCFKAHSRYTFRRKTVKIHLFKLFICPSL